MKTLTKQEIKELKKRLPEIHTLEALKMEKNFIAQEKGYPRQPYRAPDQPPSYLIHRIKEEINELETAYKKVNTENMLEELADISNLIDYLFESLTRFKFNNLKFDLETSEKLRPKK